MRLLLLTNVYPNPAQPTRGTFNFEMAKAFRRAGHEVEVVAPVPWTEEWQFTRAGRHLGSDRRASEGGVPAHYPRYYFTPKVLRPWYGQFLWQSIKGTVLPLVRASRPDAVLAYWAHPDGFAGMQAARSAGCPLAVVVGGSDVLVLCRNPARRRCVTEVLQAADVVLAVSEDLRAKITELGVPAEKVHLGYCGVDAAQFCPGDRAEARGRLGLPLQGRLLLCVAALVPVKGHIHLLDACGLLRRQGEEFQLMLVGRGPLEGELRRKCAALGIEDTVRFVGPVPHDDLPDWYRAADLTVLPSLSEGVPNVLLESMACGVPFVASRVGGIPEIATEPLDRLVPSGDAAALAGAISAALTSPAEGIERKFRPGSWTQAAEHAAALLQQAGTSRKRNNGRCNP